MVAEEHVSTAQDTKRRTGPRWILLGLLLGVLVAGLVVSAAIVFARGAGSGIGDRVSSLSDPPADAAKQREKALAAARDFVQGFYTYGPDLLDDNQKMPKYAAIGDLMTTKFRKVFDENRVLAEQTVAQTGIDRVASVYGIGVTTIDDDSATLLVGGIVNSSYPSPDDPAERIDFAPQRFRYEVSLVKQDGRWLADDLDDVDDSLPPLGESSAGGAPGGSPAPQPSDGPATDAPSGSASTPQGSASP